MNTLRGYGKQVKPGDFIVLHRFDNREIRGILIACEIDDDFELRAGQLTNIHMLIQGDPDPSREGHTTGPTSFYLHRKDRIVSVARDFVKHVNRMIED